MATITKSLTIESQGTYNLTFDLWSYSEWAASAGITTSYASLAALIADEKAVRQLMTVHASVDYFANCPDSTIISTVINNDLCAKWINLRDYALDTLSAKSNIKSVMDAADKYGYGEWGKIDSTTWGALGCVPIMTSNNAPYGVASAYQVFDGNASTSASGTDFSYQSVNPICVRKFECSVSGGTLQGSNDGSTYTTISNPSTNTTYYMYHRVHFASSQTVHTLQFYGRELKPLVPTMTADNKPKGTIEYSSGALNTGSYAPKNVFDGNVSTTEYFGTGSVSNQYIGYHAVNEFLPKMAVYTIATPSSSPASQTAKIQEYVDGEWTDISSNITDISTSQKVSALTASKPSDKVRFFIVSASSTNQSWGAGFLTELQFYGMDYSEKEFAQGSTMKYIYDHGVELVELQHDATGTGNIAVNKGYEIYNKIQTMSGKTFTETTQKLVLSPYSILRAIVGDEYYRSNEGGVPLMLSTTSALVSVDYYANRLAMINPTMAQVKQDPYNIYTIDISSVSQDGYLSYGNGYSSTSITSIGTLKEIWLE